MELALYCPVYGYYEREKDTAGREGDYYTSVTVGEVFGELLAYQFAEWLSRCGVGPLQIVEAGAHDGELAKDILSWLRAHRRELFERLEYWIVEPSARRNEVQQSNLAEFESRVRWAGDLRDLPQKADGVRGVIFSNELLDAVPVHRLGWDAKKGAWFEWGIGLEGEEFGWVRMPLEEGAQGLTAKVSLAAELLEVLPDGFTTEICPAAEQWWREAAGLLRSGKLMTIDYGLESEEFLAPQRNKGTLRAYYRHHPSNDPLANPGEQDLTADVDFAAIRSAGQSAGLTTETFLTQTQFLTQIAARTWDGKTSFGEWTAARRRQFQTLTHPDHLGRAFRVLVQSR
jgi:SAM-dependent MidA family methyltransferase